MSVAQFDNGYWYAVDLKRFAKAVGIPSAHRLRKDQLESAIRKFLATGSITKAPKRKSATPTQRDVDRGLRPGLRVVAFTNDAATKAFLQREARKLAPNFRQRSGSRYRLNRWRDEQLAKNVPITYKDLVREYVRLNEPATKFARIPTTRYINFVSDFLRAEPGATRKQATRAWTQLKAMDVPKTYRDWARSRRARA